MTRRLWKRSENVDLREDEPVHRDGKKMRGA